MKNVMATTAENRIRAFISGIPEKPTPPPKLDAVVKEVEQAPAPPEVKKAKKVSVCVHHVMCPPSCSLKKMVTSSLSLRATF